MLPSVDQPKFAMAAVEQYKEESNQSNRGWLGGGLGEGDGGDGDGDGGGEGGGGDGDGGDGGG